MGLIRLRRFTQFSTFTRCRDRRDKVYKFLRSLFGTGASEPPVARIHEIRNRLGILSDEELKTFAQRTTDRLETIAAGAVIASRVLQLEMFDVQLEGALALTEGKIAEMQTGEGKTLTAVPAAAWFAKTAGSVHVLTVNDYLARRDAQWMGEIYKWFGLSVAYIERDMDTATRRRAYSCDVTYATANEIGFDYLRDQLALYPQEQVHRGFAAAVIDEADSILIDEARIPLVIAGGDAAPETLPYRVDAVTRYFHRGVHYTLDEYGRNVALTDTGTHSVEAAFRCGNLYNAENLTLLAAVQDSDRKSTRLNSSHANISY